MLRPKPAGLPFGHNGTEAAAARRTRAVLAAKIDVIRGDLWAEAAFTGARFMGTDRSTSLDRANSGQFARARANAEAALEFAPVNGAAWLFPASLPASSQDGENRVGTLLELSYFTAPSALDLAPRRLERRNSLVLKVPWGSTIKLARRAESRRPCPRAKAKRNRCVPPIPQ